MAKNKKKKKEMKFKVGTFYTSATIMKRPSIGGFHPPILIECFVNVAILSGSVCKAVYSMRKIPNKVQEWVVRGA